MRPSDAERGTLGPLVADCIILAAATVDVATKTIRCPGCRRPLGAATAGVAIPMTGRRCSACPERDKGAPNGALVTAFITSSTASPTCWKGDARGPE